MFFNLLVAGNKKSDFLADLSLKNWCSGGFEKIYTGKNRKKKYREKIADLFRFFPKISPKNCFFLLFLGSKNMKTLLLMGFESTQNAWKWHPLATKPLITLIIYSANIFYILLLFICS